MCKPSTSTECVEEAYPKLVVEVKDEEEENDDFVEEEWGEQYSLFPTNIPWESLFATGLGSFQTGFDSGAKFESELETVWDTIVILQTRAKGGGRL